MNTNYQANTTDWQGYLSTFERLLTTENPTAPYDNPAYMEYVKLNNSRQKRWLKTGVIEPKLITAIQQITTPQTWYIITEPWCGDAAHSIPFLYLMSTYNPLIDVRIVWRDTPPYMIENYLTSGGKSVPKLVARDQNENNLFHWGPRPAPCQTIYLDLKAKNAPFEEQKIILQNWYNTDKGATLQQEMATLLSRHRQY